MGDCKDNMKTTSKKTEGFLDKFKKKLSDKKKKVKKLAKTLVDLLADLSDLVSLLRVKKDEETAEQFVEQVDETSTRIEKLIAVKEKDLDSEKNQYEENLQKLSILKEIRFHIDEIIELSVSYAENNDNQTATLKQIEYHIGEAAELSLTYEKVK